MYVEMATTASQCAGQNTLSTNVDGEMNRWVRRRAEDVGLTVTEYLRRLLDLYRASVAGDVPCPECEASVYLHRGVET